MARMSQLSKRSVAGLYCHLPKSGALQRRHIAHVTRLATYGYSNRTHPGWIPIRYLHNDSSTDVSEWPKGPAEIAPRRQTRDTGEKGQYGKDEGKPGQQAPPSQSRIATEKGEKEATPESTWDGIMMSISTIPETLSSFGGSLSDYLVPDWVKILPEFMTKLQTELSMAPGSLADEIWQEANDPEINPEILWDARVRISNELCDEEKLFLRKRKLHVRRALAKYLGLDEKDIHPDDVPTIAMCGSGGGLRALVAGSSSYLSAQEAGLFDCITYTAGVSGSCWLQTLYYSSIAGQSHERLINHLKHRLGVHIAYPPPALAMINSAPTNKFLLSGVVEKFRGVPGADFGIVDIYGLLLAARLMVPKGELDLDDRDLKLSNQRRFVDNGANPLPIYTAVRHEIPHEEGQSQEDANEANKKNDAWFQWFEFTPYEMWSEELTAGIPTWAIGREFKDGKGQWRENGLALPELRIPLFLGIWGSAFCATLSHYYKEIRPAMQGLAGFMGIDQMIMERDHDLVKMHPIDPAVIPNYALGLRDYLPHSCPESMFTASNLQLMDSGMSNNLPIYPLLRPGRDVDIIIAFDASADVRTDNWLKVAEGYTKQRGIVGWPVGAGWPPADESRDQIGAELKAAQAGTEGQAAEKLAEAQEKQLLEDKGKEHGDLGYCNVWIGTTGQRVSEEEPSPSTAKQVQEDWELMRPDSGIAVIYFPFLANPKVEGVDPRKSDFMSTWNFVYTPDNIEKVVALARANFEEGKEQTRRTVRAVYERKKAARLEREAEARERRQRWKLRSGRAGKKLGEGDHGDHFS
ncbi:Cytosolic phospholipase A2 zeta [Lasiodiplodia hormozganensis]|uniref:Lysophospholipase n=1 Tax=Lasiodiplodia hormozganensis TaxID=869390 RepID=A0AA39Y2C6_9PEZI|nr:Cytosolic phospholipase A2 zeta [Lasiodiplodia hormozganensis]